MIYSGHVSPRIAIVELVIPSAFSPVLLALIYAGSVAHLKTSRGLADSGPASIEDESESHLRRSCTKGVGDPVRGEVLICIARLPLFRFDSSHDGEAQYLRPW